MAAGLTLIESKDDVCNLANAWNKDGHNHIYVDHTILGQHNPQLSFDNYGSEVKNNEMNECMEKTKGFMDNVTTIGTYYEDDHDLNWSLVGEIEEELRKKLKSLGNKATEVDPPR
ncbi:hypothetical protein ACFE04_020447 [Oxalis oulophora]